VRSKCLSAPAAAFRRFTKYCVATCDILLIVVCTHCRLRVADPDSVTLVPAENTNERITFGTIEVRCHRVDRKTVALRHLVHSL
jgi:hypothetical protein